MSINLNDALYYASMGGHQQIIDLLINYGANDYKIGFLGACRGGHQQMLQFFIDKESDLDFKKGITNAFDNGRYKIVNHLIKKEIVDINNQEYVSIICSTINYMIHMNVICNENYTFIKYIFLYQRLTNFDDVYDQYKVYIRKILLNFIIMNTQVLPVNNDIQFLIFK